MKGFLAGAAWACALCFVALSSANPLGALSQSTIDVILRLGGN